MATVGGPVAALMGDCIVSADPDVSLATLLGSCVAACIWDPHAKVGGMNHFLAPGAEAHETTTRSECRGSVLMERLLHSVLARGAAHAAGGKDSWRRQRDRECDAHRFAQY